ncbi:hypothetical protein [Sphingomonas panni]|uniref:hypothetical protein n=1 Tax=Sphingomonas panni TaxID=237612 RepID=UPI001F5BF5E0|nr:hypothetical protein [Sphingomonas panni]
MRAIVTPVFAVLLVGLATPSQAQTRSELDAAADARYAQLEPGMVELKRIDGDLAVMQARSNSLRSSSEVRSQFLRTLRNRYPSLVVGDGTSADALYAALYGYRRQVADRMRPLIEQTKAYDHRQECTRLREVEQLRTSAAKGDGSLDDLVAFLAKPMLDRPCSAGDLLPIEPATAQSVARMKQRFDETRNRARRFAELAARP